MDSRTAPMVFLLVFRTNMRPISIKRPALLSLQNPLNYTIIAEKCTGCTLCSRVCPVGAITGTVKQPHVIDHEKCIKCGACREKCRFGAIVKE